MNAYDFTGGRGMCQVGGEKITSDGCRITEIFLQNYI
jgi:hypothetical protein